MLSFVLSWPTCACLGVTLRVEACLGLTLRVEAAPYSDLVYAMASHRGVLAGKEVVNEVPERVAEVGLGGRPRNLARPMAYLSEAGSSMEKEARHAVK